ncbi:MAG: nuclear transport factor 2 family protein [Blastocatellia bacterium]|nr:nuclear transport factor 2 family protein [Blastocatellia bacterium]
MKTNLLLVMLITLAVSMTGYSQTDADREGVKRAALDYAESFYEGNGEKMEAALSPDLAKRIANTNAQGRSSLGQMSALTLVQIIRTGSGKNTPKDEQIKNVTILDMMTNSATVKLEMRDWVDYIHIAKMNGKWVIVNVLWENKPKKDDKKN